MNIRSSVLRWLSAVCVAAAWPIVPADAQVKSRVVAAGQSMTVRSCSQRSCDVVAELPGGHAVEILKIEGSWLQVLVTLAGPRLTTGWVEAATVSAAPKPVAPAASGQGAARPAPLGGGAFAGTPATGGAQATGPADPNCLACLVTRTATADEWSAALGLTSDMKVPALPAAPEGAVAATARARLDTVRRDGRTAAERMRDDLEARFGSELKGLSEVAVGLDAELQSYMTACYDRFLPVAFVVPSEPPAVPASRPVRPRATLFDVWRGRPAFAWNETWTTQPLLSAQSTVFCEGLWKRVSDGAAGVRAGIERVESAARLDDIYPGVVRDMLQAYGLAEQRP